MARYLLDSDAIIDFLYGIRASMALIEALFASEDTPCTCDIVIAEIHAGLHPRERSRGEQLLSGLEYLPMTRASARQAGVWRYAYLRQGKTIAMADCLIAAVAVDHRASLVTGNLKDFPMPELKLTPLPRSRPNDSR